MLNPTWSCHRCRQPSAHVVLTPCGCPYHADCLPAACHVHGLPTAHSAGVAVPVRAAGDRRGLLREIQAAGLAGCRVHTLCLRWAGGDLEHLVGQGLVVVSPHGRAVYDAQLLLPVCGRATV